MRKIAVIYSGHAPHYRTFHEPKYAQYIEELIYFPDFENTDLTSFDVLIVPSQLNLNLLMKSSEKIHEFANSGKIIVVFGPQPCNWLPNQKWEDRPTNFWWWLDKNSDSGLRIKNEDHPFFDYFKLENCTWHQHGVYWPPEHVTTLIETKDKGSILYIDEKSTNGTWIITTLDPEYHYGSYFMPATEYFLDTLFSWLSFGKLTK